MWLKSGKQYGLLGVNDSSKTTLMSSGWRMRLALARAMLQKADTVLENLKPARCNQ
jgi:ATPase subunit of ABC transporter with duplicated ATPase domains